MTSEQHTDESIENPVNSAEEAVSAGDPSGSVDTSPAAEGTVEYYEQELAKARQEAAEHHERFLRAVADLENYRRRVTREKEDIRKFALGDFFEEFIVVLDNFYYGMDAASQHSETKGMLAGFSMVFDQLKTLLKDKGLEELMPQGEKFDPNFHECFAQQPSEEVAEGNVLQVIRRGYILNGRLLRPASVIVSSGKPESKDGEEK